MNLHDDELGRLLGDGLRAHLHHDETRPGTPRNAITVTDVHTKAGTITRNRRIGAAVAALAAAAVIGPAVALVSNDNPRSVQPPVTDVSPTPDGTDSGDYTPGQPIRYVDLGQGAQPGIGWAEVAPDPGGADPDGTDPDGTALAEIHSPSGDSFPAPAGSVMNFAQMGAGWAVSTWRNDPPPYQLWVGEQGEVDGAPIDSLTAPAFSASGAVAWLDGDQGVHVLAGTETYDLGTLPGLKRGDYELRGLSGDCAAGTCRVFALGTFGARAVIIDQAGTVTALPGKRQVKSVGRDYFVAVISATDEGSCSGVFRMTDPTGEPVWQTCDYTLDYISPNDDYVLGLPAYFDGLGPMTVDMLDLTDGAKVASWPWAQDSVTFARFAWEGDSSFLVTTWQADETAILRLDTDGNAELASDRWKDPDLFGRFLLEGP